MTKPILLSLALAAGVSAAAGTAAAADSPQQFLETAIRGDNAEIALGQLAQQKGGSDQVRSFGAKLVQDHTTGKQQAADVAKTLKVTPPGDMPSEAQAEHDKLAGLSGDAFDREFVPYAITDHTKDIAAYEAEARDDHGPAGQLATRQLPVLRNHLEMAQKIHPTGTPTAEAPPISRFPSQEGADTWRASKLVNVAIYGPNNDKVGNITDVLMDHEGKATAVIIGVGGFLGIGEKNVAVPFADVTFSQQPLPSSGSAGQATATTGMATQATGAPATAGQPAPATGLAGNASSTMGTSGMAGGAAAPANPPAKATDTAAQQASMAYPDHGTISLTADQLKAAPSFQYAR